MNNFGILLDETYTDKLMFLVEYMEMNPEEIIYAAIDTLMKAVPSAVEED